MVKVFAGGLLAALAGARFGIVWLWSLNVGKFLIAPCFFLSFSPFLLSLFPPFPSHLSAPSFCPGAGGSHGLAASRGSGWWRWWCWPGLVLAGAPRCGCWLLGAVCWCYAWAVLVGSTGAGGACCRLICLLFLALAHYHKYCIKRGTNLCAIFRH